MTDIQMHHVARLFSVWHSIESISVSYFHCSKVRTRSVDSLMKGILSNFLVRLRISLFSFKQVPRRKEKEGGKFKMHIMILKIQCISILI